MVHTTNSASYLALFVPHRTVNSPSLLCKQTRTRLISFPAFLVARFPPPISHPDRSLMLPPSAPATALSTSSHRTAPCRSRNLHAVAPSSPSKFARPAPPQPPPRSGPRSTLRGPAWQREKKLPPRSTRSRSFERAIPREERPGSVDGPKLRALESALTTADCAPFARRVGHSQLVVGRYAQAQATGILWHRMAQHSTA